jgi:hypothetical protein
MSVLRPGGCRAKTYRVSILGHGGTRDELATVNDIYDHGDELTGGATVFPKVRRAMRSEMTQ